MATRKLEKDLIFFNPGQPGQIFTYPAGYILDFDMLYNTSNYLEDIIGDDIVYIEDRRMQPRSD
jgi:hypothetical protein